VDPDPDSESGSRRAKITHKNGRPMDRLIAIFDKKNKQ
jgi:hypothetical protein